MGLLIYALLLATNPLVWNWTKKLIEVGTFIGVDLAAFAVLLVALSLAYYFNRLEDRYNAGLVDGYSAALVGCYKLWRHGAKAGHCLSSARHTNVLSSPDTLPHMGLHRYLVGARPSTRFLAL